MLDTDEENSEQKQQNERKYWENITEEPTGKKIYTIVENLKKNKRPDVNGISDESIKYAGIKLKQKIYELVKGIWKQEKMTRNWKNAIIIPIHQK